MKKKKFLYLLTLCLLLGTAGCAKDTADDIIGEMPSGDIDADDPLDDTPLDDVSLNDAADSELNYHYMTFDVKDFDSTKFDGVIKITEDDRNDQFQAPLTWSALTEKGYFAEYGGESDQEWSTTPLDETTEWGDTDLYYLDSEGETEWAFRGLSVPNLHLPDNTPGNYLNQNIFWITDYADSGIELTDILNMNCDPDVSHYPSSLIDTLGAPSGVLGMEVAVGDLTPIGSFCYVYDYGEYVLAFDITDFGDGDASVNGFHYFHKDAFSYWKDLWTDEEEGIYTVLAE